MISLASVILKPGKIVLAPCSCEPEMMQREVFCIFSVRRKSSIALIYVFTSEHILTRISGRNKQWMIYRMPESTHKQRQNNTYYNNIPVIVTKSIQHKQHKTSCF